MRCCVDLELFRQMIGAKSMQTFIINFLLGTLGVFFIFLIPLFLKKEKFSVPFFIVIIGLLCGLSSLFFGYASTFSIICLYFVFTVIELLRGNKK